MGFGIVQKSWHLAEKCPSRFSEDRDSQNRKFSLKSLFMLGFWCLTSQNVPLDKLHWYLMPNNQAFIEKVKKSLKNNFGFLKKFHHLLKISAAACRPQKNFPKFFFQIVRLTILGKVMASWGLFNVITKKHQGGGNHPPRSSRVNKSKKKKALSLSLQPVGVCACMKFWNKQIAYNIQRYSNVNL